jgi:hypothetical protein
VNVAQCWIRPAENSRFLPGGRLFTIESIPSLEPSMCSPILRRSRRLFTQSLEGRALSFAFNFARPLFSWSYELLFPQPPRFHHFLRCPPGCHPPRYSCRSLAPLWSHTSATNSFLTSTYSLFFALCSLFRGVSLCFQSLVDSFAKYRGGGSRFPKLPRNSAASDSAPLSPCPCFCALLLPVISSEPV